MLKQVAEGVLIHQAEPISYAHGSNRIARMCRHCVTAVFTTTRGSAQRPRSAKFGCPACMNGN